MSVTLTVNYKETFEPDTVETIRVLTEENSYDLGAILEFIDEHSEKEFRFFYEDYVELGERVGYEAVDAFLTLFDFDELENFDQYYIGEFIRAEAMAEDYMDYEVQVMDHRFVIDWQATAENLLDHEVDQVGDFYFRNYI